MKCLICERFSLSHICKICQKTFLKPTISKRKIIDDFYVISFYKYKNIEKLLKTKHKFIGSFIYKILAQNSFKIFAQNYKGKSKIFVLPIDDRVKEFYSHTAILAKEMKNSSFIPLYSKLQAKNQVSYSGKSYEYRLKNPRNFKYLGPKDIDIILVDDIITTGFTIKEAYESIKDVTKPLFALTLADARD